MIRLLSVAEWLDTLPKSTEFFPYSLSGCVVAQFIIDGLVRRGTPRSSINVSSYALESYVDILPDGPSYTIVHDYDVAILVNRFDDQCDGSLDVAKSIVADIISKSREIIDVGGSARVQVVDSALDFSPVS